MKGGNKHDRECNAKRLPCGEGALELWVVSKNGLTQSLKSWPDIPQRFESKVVCKHGTGGSNLDVGRHLVVFNNTDRHYVSEVVVA